MISYYEYNRFKVLSNQSRNEIKGKNRKEIFGEVKFEMKYLKYY